jgi:hypothetical protein
MASRTGEGKSERKKSALSEETVLDSMEHYLSSSSFETDLQVAFSKAARGTPSVISDSILLKIFELLCDSFPKELRKAVPTPSQDFIAGALKGLESERPRHACWRVEDVGVITQTVLVSMAASVDKFREMGGYKVDATKL